MGTRSYFLLAAVIAASMMVAVGCRSRRSGGGGGGGGTDSGTPMTDGGGGGTDSGPTGTDSGPTGTDSGPTPECFTSGDCATGEECVEGMCQATTMTCTEELVPTTGPDCEYATAECWDGCADGDCRQACLDADATPDQCNACVQQNFISCTNDAGCQDEYNCWAECVNEFGCTDRACVTTNCLTEDDTWNACIDALPSSLDCSSQLSMCFSSP